MLKYKDFLNENNKEVWEYEGNFIVTEHMVDNGKFIEGKIPTAITGFFSCSDNNLTSLEGGPNIVGGDFDCSSNELTNLEGGPNIVGEYFRCNANQLTSLEGAPKNIKVVFYCSGNTNNLKIEKEFIESGDFINDYYADLLSYCMKNKIDLEKIESWPKDFLTDNIKTSAKGINKFKL